MITRLHNMSQSTVTEGTVTTEIFRSDFSYFREVEERVSYELLRNNWFLLLKEHYSWKLLGNERLKRAEQKEKILNWKVVNMIPHKEREREKKKRKKESLYHSTIILCLRKMTIEGVFDSFFLKVLENQICQYSTFQITFLDLILWFLAI